MCSLITKVCEGCGKPFQIAPYRKDSARFCSADCRKRRVVEPCAHCGKPVERTRCEFTKRAHAFCDQACYGAWRKTLVGESAPRWNGGPAILTCEQCGKAYTRKQKDVKRLGSRFCSNGCHNAWKSTSMMGENNRNWQGGEVDGEYYGPEWPIIREQARQRDNYTCQRCGLLQSEHHKALDVHHIVALREFLPDRITEAHSLDNLITLCSSCHRTLHNLAAVTL